MDRCQQCGRTLPIEEKKVGRPRMYCKDRNCSRRAAWNAWYRRLPPSKKAERFMRTGKDFITRYHRLKSEGKCTTCGKDVPEEIGGTRCPACSYKRNVEER